MISKPATVRREEHKRRVFEMHLKLKSSNLKQSIYITTAGSKPHGTKADQDGGE